MVEKLKVINKKLIELNKDNFDEANKQKIIKEILDDSMCFFKMDIETAYSILKDLQIKDEDIKSVYQELIDIKNFN